MSEYMIPPAPVSACPHCGGSDYESNGRLNDAPGFDDPLHVWAYTCLDCDNVWESPRVA